MRFAISDFFSVALYTGAWIEIPEETIMKQFGEVSHSIRVRGLKSEHNKVLEELQAVALYTGAWIEIICSCVLAINSLGRTLYGCVD